MKKLHFDEKDHWILFHSHPNTFFIKNTIMNTTSLIWVTPAYVWTLWAPLTSQPPAPPHTHTPPSSSTGQWGTQCTVRPTLLPISSPERSSPARSANRSVQARPPGPPEAHYICSDQKAPSPRPSPTGGSSSLRAGLRVRGSKTEKPVFWHDTRTI